MKVYVLVTWDRFEEEVKDVQVFASNIDATHEMNKPEDNIWLCKEIWEEEMV